MGDFAERRVDKLSCFAKLRVVGVRVGNSDFVRGVENFRDKFLGQAGAFAIGILGGHGGEVEDKEEPGDNYCDGYGKEDLLFTFWRVHFCLSLTFRICSLLLVDWLSCKIL